MPDGVVGGISAQPLAAGQAPNKTPDLLSASTTLLQSGGGGYARLINALQSLDQAQNIFTLASQAANFATDIATLQNQVATLQAQVGTLQTQVSTLQTQAAAFTAFMASFNYQQIEVSTGSYYLDNRIMYRRSFVVPGSVLGTPNQVGIYAHGVPAISYIVTIQAIAGVPQGQFLPITFLQTAQAPMVNGLSVWADATNIYFSVGNTAFGTYTLIATMWYTATNR